MPNDTAAHLVLGTAQLGMAYGIANRRGRPDRDGAFAILSRAWARGVRFVDTAQAYGDGEAVIGDFLARHPECGFGVISKLDPGRATADAGAIAEAISASRDRIGRPLAAMLLHDAARLDDWDGPVGHALRDGVERGAVQALGISVYTPAEFERALEVDGLGIIQAPFNAFDRRLAETGLLERARARGLQVHLRSCFLQGLLVMERCDLPPHMAFAADAITHWRALCSAHNVAPAEAALRFVRTAVPAANIVVGCETADQLEGNLNALRAPPLAPEFVAAIAALPPACGRLLNPALWPPCHRRSA
ncbi:MAG: aldo/keto reductase [Alphaproteobacteria bacterium]